MNLPNKLTIFRVILIPFMMFFYLADFIPYGIGKIVALVIFVVGALTDLLDGKIARKYNLVTNFGKFLDPIADKMLTSTVFFLIVADGTIPHPWGAIMVTIIISREFIVSALRLIASSKGVVLAADMWGKVKTVLQMLSIIFYYFAAAFAGPADVMAVELLGSALCWLVAAVTAISGIKYLADNRHFINTAK